MYEINVINAKEVWEEALQFRNGNFKMLQFNNHIMERTTLKQESTKILNQPTPQNR